jgi:hypothetical protein
VLLGTGIVAALIEWPYPAACGAGLGVYLGLVGALGLAGVTTSTSAWRHRAPFVHLLGLAMVVAAAVLGAREVLPRVGYAVPAPGTPATWACEAGTPGTAAPAAGRPRRGRRRRGRRCRRPRPDRPEGGGGGRPDRLTLRRPDRATA